MPRHPIRRQGLAVPILPIFNITTVNSSQIVNLDAPESALGLVFNSTGPVLIQTGSGANTLNLGASGITVHSGAGVDTISAAVNLASPQSWTNSSKSLFTVGGNITSGANLLTIDGAGDTTIGGILGAGSGTGGLLMSGIGTLTLGNSNVFSGGVTINSGTLQLANPGTLNATTPNAVVFGAGSTGTLSLNGNSVTVSGLSTDATPGTPIVQNASTTSGSALTVNNNVTNTYGGVLQDGPGGAALLLIKSGTGTLILSGANTYSNGTFVSGGTLQGDATSLQGNITNNASVVFNQSGSGAYSGQMSGSGNLSKTGSGTLILNGFNQYLGITTVSDGTLKLGTNGALGTADGGTIVASGATLDLFGEDIGAEALTIDQGVTLTNSNSLGASWFGDISTANLSPITVGVGGSGDVTLSGGFTPNFGIILNKTTATALNLIGTSDNYAAAVIVNNGIVRLAKTSTAANHAVGYFLTVAGGTAQLGGTGGDQIFDLAPVVVTNGSFDTNGRSETIHSLALQGGGIGGNGALLNSANGDSVLIVSDGMGNGIALTGNTSIGVSQSGGSLTLNDAISGSFGLTKVGAGMLTLGGANTFTGGVTVASGTLVQNGGLQSNVVTNQASFVYNGGNFAGQLVNQGSVTFNANFTAGNGLVNHTSITAASGFTLTLNGSGLDNEGIATLAGGTIVGTGPLVNNALISGTGTLAGSGGFTNNAQLSFGGGDMTLSNAGANVNTGTIDIPAGLQLRLTGGNLANSGVVNLNGGIVTGTATLNNNSGGTIGGHGTISSPFGSNFGSLDAESGTLNIPQGFANSGEILLGGGLATLSGAGAITNTGLVRGDGVVTKAINNNAGGEIRAENGKRLKLQATSGTNAGKINLQGGTAEFTQAMTNGTAGQIEGRGTLITGGIGLTNQGNVALSSGITDVFGDVNNSTGSATKGITISGNADVTFWDDVTNGAGSLFKVSSGSSVTVFGTYSGAGISGSANDIHLEADVSPGFSPATVDFGGNLHFSSTTRLKIELGGTTPSTQYDQVHVSEQLSLDGVLQVLLINAPFAPVAGNSFDILDWGSVERDVLVA